MRIMSFQVHEEHGLEDEPEDGVGQGLLQVQSLANVKYRCNMCNVLALWSKKKKKMLLSENSDRAANNKIT